MFLQDSPEVHMSCRLNLKFYNEVTTFVFIIIIIVFNIFFTTKNLLSNSIKRNKEITNRKKKELGEVVVFTLNSIYLIEIYILVYCIITNIVRKWEFMIYQ